jgi:ribose transport system substrate-binding protein
MRMPAFVPVGRLTSPGRAARRAALAAGLAGLLTIPAGCVTVTRSDQRASAPGGASTSPVATGAAPAGTASTGPAAVGSAPSGPAAVAATRVGYLALDEDSVFLAAVSEGIVSAARAAGVDLVTCDGGWTRDGIVACATQLGQAGVAGLVSLQPIADLAPQVCAAVGGVPTVGIVFEQGPCQVAHLAIDQAASGRLAGEALGRFAAERWACQASAYVSLESSDADPDGRARMAGYREGYQAHCPLPQRTLRLDGADRLVTAQTQLARRLAQLKGDRIIVAGITEDAILGAMAAAAAAGRSDDLWFSGQLADPAIRQRIACDPRYVASVTQHPEAYGERVMPLLLGAIDGRAVPPLVEAQLELVTAANVRELFPDTPACEG